MSLPDYNAAQIEAVSRLDSLPASFYYHSLWHTADDVFPAAQKLAAAEEISGVDLLLVQTAVLYHDIGFTVSIKQHEQIGCEMVQAVLPGFGYTQAQIQKICGMIMATKLPQLPSTVLECIVADADLDVLGRRDFLPRNQALRQELSAHGSNHSEYGWYTQQITFLRNHRYFTGSARSLRDEQKALNLCKLEALLEQAQVCP